jgi:ATP-binding cassette subfamily F protein 3
VESRLAQASAEQEELGARLQEAALSHADRAEHGRRLKTLADEVEALEMRWLELTEALDQLAAG